MCRDVAGAVSAHSLFSSESVMTYQVLARKWRPQNFTQLVGQQHVSRSLCNALQHDRLHHAYLFTGTRGVGKTTVARILAKAINCENVVDSNPCGECSVCSAFDQGSFMDLIEVDAASRTKVEDTRDLLDNVQYAPNHGRYKVYLIDEVHMLSGHSFNALLKTLEEPPPHVKFLLATTDPQKIPVTVLSRCLQFNLKRLLPEQIVSQMEYILNQEQVEYEPEALTLLARAADGSMRDGLSLLDQAIAFGNGKVRLVTVTDILGTVARQPVNEMVEALADNDAPKLLNKIAEVSELTPDYADILQQMLKLFHSLTIHQTIPGFLESQFDDEVIVSLAEKLSGEDIQLYYQIALLGQKDLNLAPDPRCGFEMVMLRMLAFKPVDKNALAKPIQKTSHSTDEAVEARSAVAREQKPDAVTQPDIIESRNNAEKDWSEIVIAMKLHGSARELANNCVLEKLDHEECILLLDPGHAQLGTRAEDRLLKAIQSYCGSPVKLIIRTDKTERATPAQKKVQDKVDKQQAAVDAINTDENIEALKSHFDARVVPGSIEPIDK